MQNKETARIVNVVSETASNKKIFLSQQIFTECTYDGCDFVYQKESTALFGANNKVTGGMMMFGDVDSKMVAACFASYILARGYDLPPEMVEFVERVTTDILAMEMK